MPIRKSYLLTALIAIVFLSGCIALYRYSHWYGFNVILKRGGSYWLDITADDDRLSSAMKLALKSPDIPVTSGSLTWHRRAPGFETAELDVIAQGKVIDRILLNRINPAYYEFVALNASAGNRTLADWEDALPQAQLIVNGSYFDRYGIPSTPFVSQGKFTGISPYNAKAGAVVSKNGKLSVVDLSLGQPWQDVFKGAQNAMVSYPLLIGEDGENHVRSPSRWLANRTFIAEDHAGNILIGTTEDAFFSIYRLAEFLRSAPLSSALDIKVALNLDGGPVACQSVRVGNFNRHFIAKWELQADQHGENIKLLSWPLGDYGSWAMAVVLAVTPKNQTQNGDLP